MAEINLAQQMRFRVDLDTGLVTHPLRTHLNYGDVNANRMVVEVTQGGEPAELTGMSATGAFYRPGDGAQVPLTGTVSGSEVIVQLIDHCYTTEGQYEAEVKLTQGGVTRTILSITGYVHRAGSGAVVDVSGVIPSLDALLAQIQATRDAAVAASNAATAANNAATAANNAAEAADEAAENANNAAAKIDGMTVSAEASSEPSATITERNGVKHITFGLKTGATPVMTFEVATGAAGTQVQIEQSGTPEAPHIKLTIPRGDTGSVEGIDYYEGNPAPLGEASPGTANGVARGNHVHPMPTAEQVGALPKDGTAADSAKLGDKTWAERLLEVYPIGSIYMSVNSTSPASLFGGTWEQVKDRFLLGAGDSYALGSTGGAAAHALTTDEMPSHFHWLPMYTKSATATTGMTGGYTEFRNIDPTASHFSSEATGGGSAFSIMPPYLAVNVWKRVS